MIDIEVQKESLLKSADIAAKALRKKALESAITLDSLSNGVPDPAAGTAKELLRKAVEDAGMLVAEATEAAKGLLAQAAELAANHKKTLMMKAIADAEEADVSFSKAAEVVEAQKKSLLMKAKVAAETLKGKAAEEARDVVNLADGIPHAAHGVAKELLDDSIVNAKSLLREASEDAASLLAIAAERAQFLLSKDKEIEEELLNLQKLASVAILAGGIAHDFNNILTGVFGNLEMAKLKLSPNHAAYQYILNATQSMDRATDLTTQLLTFAKGGEPLFEIIDIRKIIHDSIKFSLSQSSVEPILTLQQDLWMLNADKGQLSQVIINLLVNADQAMPEGGTLTIEASNIEEFSDDLRPHLSGEYICFKIGDDGVGMSEEQQRRIFDPYFSTKHSGNGLGLAITHSIIAKHNGHISVKSKLGKGTTFSIYFPAETDAQILDSALSNDTKNPIKNSANILFMDDDEDIRSLSADLLESLGHSVETAIDGKQAIAKYIEADKYGRPFDLVILDLTIPGGMGGQDVIKELLVINPQLRAIVTSGYATGEVLSNYAEYGFKGRVVKPFLIETMEAELLKILDCV